MKDAMRRIRDLAVLEASRWEPGSAYHRIAAIATEALAAEAAEEKLVLPVLDLISHVEGKFE